MVNKKMLHRIIAAESITAAATLSGLAVFWYADYPLSHFHFFNDNREWLQQDKISHAVASYYIGRTGYNLLRLPGVDGKKATWYGGVTGLVYLAGIELMDGFSTQWGASPGDIAANTLGSAVFIGQQLAWDEQRIVLKWSYHNSRYAKYRPEILGRNFPERIFKDYNGQTYWFSANISSFLHGNRKIPGWLNIALGYSADGMTGGYINPVEADGIPIPHFERSRQYLLSLDLDLTRIKTRSKTINMLLDVLGVLKIPFPAVEYNSKQGLIMHPLYF
jgi:hypothetical protein